MVVWEVLHVSVRDDKYFMEMSDGDSYRLVPIPEDDAYILWNSLRAGNRVTARSLW